MSKTCKKRIALLLVLLQLVVLMPVTAVNTKAVDNQPADTGAAVEETEAVQPNYNPVYFGTVQFGTFNYTAADESTGLDGADYVMPFVYTDDYFAAPSYSDPASAKELPWTALED